MKRRIKVKEKSKGPVTIDRIVGSYGDLIFDLCSSLLSNSMNAQIACRSILKKIRSESKYQNYKVYERSWVLRLTCDKLLDVCRHHGYLITAEEQIRLDASENPESRLHQFDSFFHRLRPEEKILLSLRAKHQIPVSEISTAMAIPVDSLNLQYEQAIRSLEDWLWNSRADKNTSERLERSQAILNSITQQEKVALPADIKEAPLVGTRPSVETAWIAFSGWEQIPWYLRTVIEAAGICTAISMVIISAPKVRSLYEVHIEKSLLEFRESLLVKDSPLDGSQLQIPPAQLKSMAQSDEGSEEELNGEDDAEDENVSVGRAQLWRFTLKTVSPDELRPQIYNLLLQQNIPATTTGLAGTLVPGGVEFDLVLPQSTVNNIKKALQKLSPEEDSFSWYRVKSKRTLPEGKSQVVIWLSQPTAINPQ